MNLTLRTYTRPMITKETITMTTKEYNGWTNYETWNVALWVDNDEGSYHYWRDLTIECIAEGNPSRELADRLEESIKDRSPLASDASCYSDLLGSALDNVNWREIAENWLEIMEDDQ